MHKVLVIASTEHSLRSKEELLKSGLSFDYLIANKNSVYDFGCLDEQSINIGQEMVPFSENSQFIHLTPSQKKKKTLVHPQMNQLRHILFQNLIQKPQLTQKNESQRLSIEGFAAAQPEVLYFDDVIDFKINNKDKKIYLEVKKTGVRNYDHVLLEDSYLNLSLFNEKFKDHSQEQNQNADVFKIRTQQVFQLIGLKFKISEDLGDLKFWFMTDPNYNSIYDNMYFLSTKNNVMDVWLWLPAQQLQNPTTKDYFAARVQKHLEKKFDYLKFEIMSEALQLQPINTYMQTDCYFKNQITFLPQFHFYTNEQMNKALNALTETVIKKLKIKKEFIKKNLVEESI